MKRLRVLVDVDGFVADFRGMYIACCNAANGTTFTAKDAGNDWSIAKALGLTMKQTRAAWDMVNMPGVAANLSPLPVGVSLVKELMRHHEVYFVTSPVPSSPTWTYDRNAWLKKHFDSDAVVYTAYKHVVAGDVLIDDKPSNVDDWMRYQHRGARGIVWSDGPEKNHAGKLHAWASRVRWTTSGSDALEFIQELARG